MFVRTIYYRFSTVALSVCVLPLSLPAACPTQVEQWESMRSELTGEIGRFATNGVTAKTVEYLSRERQFVELNSEELNKCVEAAQPSVQACMKNAAVWHQYVSAFTGKGGEEVSLWQEFNRKQKMQKYFADNREILEVPSEFSSTDLLRPLVSGDAIKKDGVAIIEWNAESQKPQVESQLNKINQLRVQLGKKPMEWLFYRAQQPSIGIASTYERLLLRVPSVDSKGRNYEQWIQFAPGGNLVGVISVVENPPGKFESFFKDNLITPAHALDSKAQADYNRFGDKRKELIADKALHVAYPQFNVGSESCTACHVSGGPFPIWPTRPLDDKSEAVLSEFNARFGEYGNSFSSSEFPRPFAIPRLGEVKTRTPAELANCLKPEEGETFSAVSPAKIIGAMNCVTCHNDSKRPGLRFPLSTNSSGWKHPVINGHMPRDNNLTSSERNALARCLWKDYLGTIAGWLNATPCSADETKGSTLHNVNPNLKPRHQSPTSPK